MNIWWYSNNMWIIYSQPYVDLIIVQYMWFHDSIILTYTHQCLGRLSIREIPTWTRFFHETTYFWTNTALILVCESIWDCAQKYGGHFGNGYVLVLSSRAFGSIVPAHSHPQKQNMLRANTQLVWVWIRTQFWACFHWYHFVGSNNYPLLVGTIPMFSVYTPRSCCLCIYYIYIPWSMDTYVYLPINI